MTKLQLEKLGMISTQTKLCPNRYWCNTTLTQINIYSTTTMEEVLEMIFDEGKVQGIISGKEQRSNDFMNLLNNTDL